LVMLQADHECSMEEWFDGRVELAERSTHSPLLLHQRDMILQHVPKKEGARYLDLGCGTGFLALGLLNELPDCQVVGFDISALNLGVAKRKTRTKACRGFVPLRGTALMLPFDDSAFLSVFCRAVLIYLFDIPRALKEIQKVLAKGGVFVACEPVFRYPIPKAMCAKIRRHFRVWDNAYRMSRKGMIDWLAKASFSKVEVYEEMECPQFVQDLRDVDRFLHYSPWGTGIWEAGMASGISERDLEDLRKSLYAKALRGKLSFKPLNLYITAVK